MRTFRLALLVIVPVLAFSGCIVAIGHGVHPGHFWSGKRGSGVAAIQTRQVPEFHALRIEGSCDAKVAIGAECSVLVTADDNLIGDVVTEVKDGVLVIGMKDGTNDSFRVGPYASITVPSLDGVTIEGSGNVEVQGVSGDKFSAHISGSGDLEASGRATQLEAGIEGSGDMDLGALEAQEARVSIDGSGDVRVRCSASLTASVS
ncbi:MAG TPA: head GIN domain-containing protein, partial [Planctomycetota bacterium]|nr:head GIN domain-containing protein [Planctomycetota bacterium]